MKYTIELTNKQKDTFECLLAITKRFIGFNVKLEPITSDVAGYMTSEEIKAIKEKAKQEGYDTGYKQGVSDSKVKIEQAYKDGYNKGYEDGAKNQDEVQYKNGFADGKNDAVYNTELIDELKQAEYNRGLEDAQEYIEKLYHYGMRELENEFDDYSIPDIIRNNSMTDIIAIIKAYEEKKKAEIEIGDVVTHEKGGIMIVTRVNKLTKTISGVCADGEYFDRDMAKWHKTGKHYDIESILKELANEV